MKCEKCGEVSWLMVKEDRYLCHGCYLRSKGGKMSKQQDNAESFFLQVVASQSKVPIPVETGERGIVENFLIGRKRMLRPVLEPAQQKRIEERKIAKAKEDNIGKFLDKERVMILDKEWDEIRSTVDNWTRSTRGGERVFICEASDNLATCPMCKKHINLETRRSTFQEIDQEGEVQAWHFKHSCGAQLVVLDDD